MRAKTSGTNSLTSKWTIHATNVAFAHSLPCFVCDPMSDSEPVDYSSRIRRAGRRHAVASREDGELKSV